MQRVTYNCPVCGYNELSNPPKDYMICPCCGTEFGNDDFEVSHEELRKAWLRAGAQWFSEHTPKPSDWSPSMQLIGAGLIAVLALSNSTGQQTSDVHLARELESASFLISRSHRLQMRAA